MQRFIMIIAGTISIASGLLKLRSVRRRPDELPLKALCLGLLAFGSAFLVLAPPHTTAISELLHIPNSGRLLGNILTLSSAGAMQVMMLHLVHPAAVARPRVKIRLFVLAGIAVVMSLLLFSAHTVNDTKFVEHYATYTPITIYQLLYLGFLGVAVVDLINLSVRYSRHVNAMLKFGLRMVAAGGVIYAFHTGYKILLITAAWMAWAVPGDESLISTTLAASGGVLIAAGCTVPVWGPRVTRPWHLLRQYRSYRRLEPLWRPLSTALPEVMLPSANGVDGGSPLRQIDIRLYRRVIEIRDAQLLLESFGDPETVAYAQKVACEKKLTGDRLRAYIDATVLSTALNRKIAAGDDEPVAGTPRQSRGSASLRQETRYLEEVAAAFTSLRNAVKTDSFLPLRHTDIERETSQ